MRDGAATAGRLIPILREAIAVIQMILYKELKPHLSKNYGDLSHPDVQRLAGAVVNTVFGTVPGEKGRFAIHGKGENAVEKEVNEIGSRFSHLRIPLTDALRMQFLCDSLEGIDSESVLCRASEAGILLTDREVPFPNNFITMARRLGVAYKLLSPMDLEEE